MDNVEHIVPQLVGFSYVSVEATLRFFVEGGPVDVADVALTFFVVLHLVLGVPQQCKGVDHDTCQYVEHDDVDHNVETCIVEKFYCVLLGGLLVVDGFRVVTNASS